MKFPFLFRIEKFGLLVSSFFFDSSFLTSKSAQVVQFSATNFTYLPCRCHGTDHCFAGAFRRDGAIAADRCHRLRRDFLHGKGCRQRNFGVSVH